MKKTFKQLMLEADEQFDYYVRSIVNIHDYDIMEMLRLSLLPYQLVDMKRAGFHPISKENEFFPEHPNSPTYSLKVKMDLPIDDTAAMIQKIATFIKVNDEYLTFYEVGSDPLKRWEEEEEEAVKDGEYVAMGSTDPENKATVDQYATPNDIAQDEVGHKRIDSFMQELDTEKKDREVAGRERDVYETFTVPHDVATLFAKIPQLKGYYLVERFKDNRKDFRMTGPFKSAPDNYKTVFSNPYQIKSTTLISESTVGKYKETILEMDTTQIRSSTKPQRGKFEVQVTDVDNGRKHNVVVNANDETNARDVAIQKVAKQYNIAPHSLIAEHPA